MTSHPLLTRRTLLMGSIAAVSVPLLGAAEARAEAGLATGHDLSRDKKPLLRPGGLKFGSYDPHGDFGSERLVATEHLFLPWEDVDLSTLYLADEYALARGRDVLVTVEPWSWAQDWNVTSPELRDLILSGARDENMRAVVEVLSRFRTPVTIRWAQEMDTPFNRFTWSDWTPADYIEAFQRMHGIIREVMPSARMMWSPRGEPELQRFYPGDAYVDLVGLTVFGFEQYDLKVHGHAMTFAEAVQQGYNLTAGYKKPIWVAELGYTGSPTYLASWVAEVTAPNPQFPMLEEVVYFNSHEVWEWPYGLGWPDWRVVSQPPYPARR